MDQPQERLERIEHHMRSTVESTRFLPAATVVVAALSFMLTTFVWRLIHQSAGVEAIVRDGIVRSTEADDRTVAELARLRNDIAAQADATARLEQRLERVEANGTATIVGLDTISGDLARQTATADDILRGVGDTRRQVLDRVTAHALEQSASRDAIVEEVSLGMQRIEQSMITQARDVREQQRQIEAAAERARASRQALLHDATQSVSLQIDGLRAILDGLRAEAGDTPVVGGRPVPDAAATGTTDEGTTTLGGEPTVTTDTDVSAATPAEGTADDPSAEPEVAARTKDTATN